MKLLLTSAGIKNTSIHDALVDLLGKPIAESSALCIPTARVRAPMGGPGARHGGSSAGEPPTPDVRTGLEVPGRAGAHRAAQHRRRALGPRGPGDRRPAGGGGDALYLCHWMRAVGTGGPAAVAARHGLGGGERRKHGDDPAASERTSSTGSRPPAATARWDVVDFSIFPHLDHADLPEQHHGRRGTMGGRHRRVPAYAIDDQTAIKVTDDAVEVVSEGHWKLFTP